MLCCAIKEKSQVHQRVACVPFVHLHSTSRMMRLLTEGGIPLEAMQRYAAESMRLILEKINSSPSWAIETRFASGLLSKKMKFI